MRNLLLLSSFANGYKKCDVSCMRPERHIDLYVNWLLKLSIINKDLNGSTIFFLRFSDTTFHKTRLSVLEFIRLCG
jgi:hypothetical protein